MPIKTKTIRSFIALPLEDKVKKQIREIENDFKELNCDIKWVKPEKTHITLKFLGDIGESQIELISQCIRNIFRNAPAIGAELSSIGTFPERHSPRVIWVGVKDSDKIIERSADALGNALATLGFKKENRPFQSHITLGRIRSPQNISVLNQKIKEFSLPGSHPFIINEVVLYKSILNSSGSVYEGLYREMLDGNCVK